MMTSKLTEENQTSTSKMAPFETTSKQLRETRVVQNFVLVWLDSHIDEASRDCQHTIKRLRRTVNTIHTFTDRHECFEYITTIKNEKVFMIVSGALGQYIAEDAQKMSQIRIVYLFCSNKHWHEQWTKDWSKIIGVFTEIDPICKSLIRVTRQCDQDSISMSFISTRDDNRTENLDKLDPSFMYSQLLKEILVDFDYDEYSRKELTDYCRKAYAENNHELRMINEFEEKYSQQAPIWWYTNECFLYKMLNHALRTLEIDIIILLGFFIRDLHQQIKQLHATQYSSESIQTFVVYRGQCMSNVEFDKLQKMQGGLMSFNDFLSTSKRYDVSMEFARPALTNSDSMGIVFVMTIDPLISTALFADVQRFSCKQDENEILFAMHAIFRIQRIECIEDNDRLWHVHLKLTRDTDEQLNRLTERMREEIQGRTGEHRLGALLIKLGQLDQARKVFNTLLDKTSNEKDKGILYHQLGRVENACGQYQQALAFYEQSRTIYHKTCSQYHPDLATLYNDIGLVYTNMNEYSNAHAFYAKSLEIYETTLPSNHPDLATAYNNMGLMYDYTGDHLTALSFYEKSLQIYRKTLPENHPNLATSYSNIGSVHYNQGDYSKALSCYEKSIQIKQQTLSTNHPSFATSYNNIGLVYRNMNEHSEALSFYEKALEIDQKTLPPSHPNLASSYMNIGRIHDTMADYSKALSFYEKSLEISTTTLPTNDRRLITVYGNIGSVYSKLGDYSKALSFYEKKHEIMQAASPPSHIDVTTVNSQTSSRDDRHELADQLLNRPQISKIAKLKPFSCPPDLITSYNDMGAMYDQIGHYQKALVFYKKALELKRTTLPKNHPDLACSYNAIGMVYHNMGDYMEALFFCKRAVHIGEETLPSNDSHLQKWKRNLETIRRKL